MKIIPAFILERITHRPNLTKIINNISWLFFDKILRMGVGLFVGVWIARYLKPEQFGLLNFALAFTGLFGAFASLGLQGIVVRDIVRNPKQAKLTLGTAALLVFVGGIVAEFFIVSSIFLLRPDDSIACSVVSILGAMMLLKVSDIAVWLFESQVQSKYTVWVQNGAFIVFALVKVSLILMSAPLIAFAWAMLAESALAALILLFVMSKRGYGLLSLSASKECARKMLLDSWPLILSTIAVTVYMKIDQIMLGQMLGDKAVGVYSAALRISEIWYFIPMAIAASVFPNILEAKKKSETQYLNKLTLLMRVLLIISVTVGILLIFLSKIIIFSLFGREYSEAAPVLIIHIWTGIFVSIGIVSGYWFLSENKQKYALLISILAALLNILLNIILIPKYQEVGAAIATLLSYAISNLVWPFIFKETRQLSKITFNSIKILKIDK